MIDDTILTPAICSGFCEKRGNVKNPSKTNRKNITYVQMDKIQYRKHISSIAGKIFDCLSE